MTQADMSVKPKYWCKHCKTFVRDTKLEKQNHEATPKHQGNLQRFLRDLHRGHEREERDAQRAKDEVARLNGIAASSTATGNGLLGRKPAIQAPSDKRQGGPADRKRQLQQLADMGIAVPADVQKEMAMAGDWQTQFVTPIYHKRDDIKAEDDSEEPKASTLAVGVRKRKYEGDEEKEEAGAVVVKKGWGSTTRSWNADNDGDLDSLLGTVSTVKRKPDTSSEVLLATDSATKTPLYGQLSQELNRVPEEQPIKRENSEDMTIPAVTPTYPTDTPLKSEEDAGTPGVFFKKRKAKPAPQKDDTLKA